MAEALTTKFANIIKDKGILVAIQAICPINLHFQLLANIKHKGTKHDLTVLLSLTGTTKLLQDPADIQGFIQNLLGEKQSSTKVLCEKVKYCGLEYFAIFIDRPQT